LDRAGKQLGSVGTPSTYRGIELSPDDRVVALHREDRQGGAGDLWLLDLLRGSTARLTLDATHSMSPVWSPDGRRIVFTRQVGASWSLHEKESSGAGSERLLYESKSFLTPLSILPDGQSVVMRVADGAAASGDFFVMRLSDARDATPYLQIPFDQAYGQLSADGRWLAYSSNESGRNEIYVQSFPALSNRYAVSTAGGTQPRWRRDGRELFYLQIPVGGGEAVLMSVTLEPTGERMKFSVPEALFNPYVASALHGGLPTVFQYAVSSDGMRFLVARRLAADTSNPGAEPLTVVFNWTAALNRR
jgi:Tol biopolymer transport system component